MTDLDKLAKSLTKAQRDAVLNSFRCEWRTIQALRKRGIVVIRTCFPDGNGLPFTPLGLALRNHLKGQNDD